jgi:S-adenosylmethionine-diacylglycerol 3-amino-3-carboxypropyl transferase
MFKLFFSETVMKKLGRDKDYFRYNEESLADMLKCKFEQGIYHNLNAENPYLQYVVLGEYRHLPLYLQKENYPIIKERIARLHIKQTDFQTEMQACEKNGDKYDFMYLSDIFEYMSADRTHALSAGVYNALNEGGQALLFNMMNNRRLSSTSALPFYEEKLDQTHDRAFYYTACYLYTKYKGASVKTEEV